MGREAEKTEEELATNGTNHTNRHEWIIGNAITRISRIGRDKWDSLKNLT